MSTDVRTTLPTIHADDGRVTVEAEDSEVTMILGEDLVLHVTRDIFGRTVVAVCDGDANHLQVLASFDRSVRTSDILPLVPMLAATARASFPYHSGTGVES